MFTKCLQYGDYECEGLRRLGDLSAKQEAYASAIDYYRQAFDMEPTAQLSFTIGKLMLEEKQPVDALDYLTWAIDHYSADALYCDAFELAQMYLHRMRCNERMGLVEHAQKDYVKVLEADPNFI